MNGSTTDVSGGGHNGHGNNLTPAVGMDGVMGHGWYFNGVNSSITIPYTPDLNVSGYTIYATLKVQGFYTGPCHGNPIFNRGSTNVTNGMYYLMFTDYPAGYGCTPTIDTNMESFVPNACGNPTCLGASYTGSSFADFNQPAHIVENQWYTVVATFNDTVFKVYINNVLVNSVGSYAPGVAMGSSTDSASIGFTPYDAAVGYPYAFHGVMDDLRLYNRALSACEIAQLYYASNPLPANDTVATGETATFNISDTDVTAIYQWQMNSGSGFTDIAEASPYSGVTTKILTITPATTIMNNNTFRCIRYSASCTDTTRVATLSVTSSSICPGSSLALTGAGGYWASSNTSVATVTSAGVVTGVAGGTVNILHFVGSTSTATTITVLTGPAAITGAAAVCIGANTTLANAMSGGTWTSSNTAIAAINTTTGLVTGVTAGTAIMTYTLSSGCFKTKTITVRSLPAAIGGIASICIGSSVTLTDATAGPAAWACSTPAVATIVGGSGVVTGVAAGTTTISYTVSSTGCMATRVITVTAVPSISGATVLCAASAATLTAGTTGGTWSSSRTGVATADAATGVVTAVSAGTASITYLAPGCRSVTIVTVNPQPNAITGPLSVCVGSAGTLSSSTTGGTWTSGNTAIATASSTGVVTGISTDTVLVTYTLATGCSRSAQVTVAAAPAISGPSTLCAGSAAAFSAAAGGTWSSSATAVATAGATTGIVTAMTTGMANITYTAGAACSAIKAITVNAAVSAISGPTAVCSGSSITLSDATPSGVWTSSNPAVAAIGSASGIVTGSITGTAVITYTLGSGCYRTAIIKVGSGVVTISGSAGLCAGLSSTFSASVSGSSWSSSNTSVVSIGAISGVATGIAPGTAIITFTPYASGAMAGCIATLPVTVDTSVSLAAITGTPYVGTGSTTLLADATAGGAWSSSNAANASVSGSGVVTGINASFTAISYTVTNGGCRQSATIVVHVVASRPGIAGSGIETMKMLRVYPNPTNGMFSLEAQSAGIFAIYTLEGKELQRNQVGVGINTLSLPQSIVSGIYMCRYMGDDGSSIVVRLIYEH